MIEFIALRQLVGENIRLLRKARGWSQEDLGEQADLSYKFVGEIERGAVNPSLDSLTRIANALAVEITELFLSEGLIVLTYDDVARIESSLDVLTNVLGTAKPKAS